MMNRMLLALMLVLPTTGVADAPAPQTWSTPLFVAAADAVMATVPPGAGFAGLDADPATGQLRLYWKGQVPAPVRQAVGTADGRVLAARYTRDEIAAALDRLRAADERRITELAPMPDGSGLSVSVDASAADAAGIAALTLAGIEVFVTPDVPPMQFTSRQADPGPHRGGATFVVTGPARSVRCTSGFAVRRAGVRTMLTAGHCGDDGQAVRDRAGRTWGTIGGDDTMHDTMLVSPVAGHTVTGVVYEGPHTSAATRPVLFPASASYVGTLMCTSGAMTGEHCRIRVVRTDMMIRVDGTDGYIGPLVKAEQLDRTVATGTGDSGGPVVAMDSIGRYPDLAGDFTNVYPTGIISAIDPGTAVSCGPADDPTSRCAWRMFYAGVVDALDRYGATILGPV